MSLTRPSPTWIKSLPYAHVPYPDRLPDKAKYYLWRVLTPLHPHIRDFLVWARVVRHEGRQQYLLGVLAEHETIESVVEYLISRGYGNHFVAWKDEGQVVSLRKATCFEYQSHIRIFEDGEVRAHYEYTTEYRPFKHLRAAGQEARREECIALLGNRITLA
jgi:hypothetical protein